MTLIVRNIKCFPYSALYPSLIIISFNNPACPEQKVILIADQEFPVSFAVEIDESGVYCLQALPEENRDPADRIAAAFSAAALAIREYEKAAGLLPPSERDASEAFYSAYMLCCPLFLMVYVVR